MFPLVLTFPEIHPIALQIGPIAVRWYGLAYAVGLLLGWTYVKRLLTTDRLWPSGKAPFVPDKADDLMLLMTLGVVVGGRLGYVLFYKPMDYLAAPWEIPQLWHGGMSFHGGFIGSAVAIVYFARREGINPFTVFDLAAAATPIGLFFGRIANFINAELWGRPSSVPWAMVFPGSEAGPAPRHPSQLYEAALEGAVLFGVCWWLIHNRDALRRPGLIAGVFTAGYGLARSLCEMFREPDPLHWATSALMTPGILYSLPMIAVGIYLVRHARHKPDIA
jgi:phosphatidylglycerol---prolipoprotein diacylglyceryl transferase